MKTSLVHNVERIQPPTHCEQCGRSPRILIAALILLAFSGCTQEKPPTTQSTAASTDNESELLLPEDERAFLWECEHRSNLLTSKSFAALTKALESGDVVTLTNCFTNNFHGTSLADSPTTRFADDTLSLHRTLHRENAVSKLNPSEFAEWLISQRGVGDSDINAGVALLSYMPAARDEMEAEWLGRAKLRITSRSNAATVEKVIEFEFTTSDFAEDPPDAGWMSTWKTIQVDSGSATTTLMREVAVERGLAPALLMDNWTCAKNLRSLNTGGIYLADFDRDGRTDIFLTEPRSLQSMMLYRGVADGHFENRTREMRLPLTTGANHAAIIDVDNDGWEDIVLLGLAVFRNIAGEYFTDATQLSNIDELIQVRGIDGISGATVADFDRDGLVDLYVTRGDATNYKSGSWIDGKSGHEANNQLLRNLGQGKFEDVTIAARASGGERSVFASTWLDANDDGWPDLYVIHEFGAGGLLINQKDGTFVEQEIATESDDFGSMGLACGDVDNDGNVDLYVSNMYSKAGNRVMDNLSDEYYDSITMEKLRRMVAGSQLHINNGQGSFSPAPNRSDIAAVGWGWGAALSDLNNDGLLDIYATCGFMSQDRQKPDG